MNKKSFLNSFNEFLESIYPTFSFLIGCITIISYMIGFFLWLQLPPIVGTHFNLIGNIDNVGSKNILLALFLLPLFPLILQEEHKEIHSNTSEAQELRKETTRRSKRNYMISKFILCIICCGTMLFLLSKSPI